MSLILNDNKGQNNLKSFGLVLLVLVLFIVGKKIFNSSPNSNTSNLTPGTEVTNIEKKEPENSNPARPKGPKSLRLPWPPKRAIMKKIIPEYEYLENTLMETAERDGIKSDKNALLKVIVQEWNALVGEGGTPLSLIKWEMGRFNLEGIKTQPIDSSIKREAHHKFKCLKDGEWVYKLGKPKYEDPFSECWKKITFTKGYDVQHHGEYALHSWGGEKIAWYKLNKIDELELWTWKSPWERKKFITDYRRKIEERIKEEESKFPKAASGGRYKSINEIARAHKNTFLALYLQEFLNVYTDISWPEP